MPLLLDPLECHFVAISINSPTRHPFPSLAFTTLNPFPTASYFAVLDPCSCSHDVLHEIRRCVQLFVQEAERVRRGPSMHLPIHIVCSRSHWLQQSLSRDFRVEQLKVGTHRKTSKSIKPNCFLFNLLSYHLGTCLPAQTHWLHSPLIPWLLIYHTLIHCLQLETLLPNFVLNKLLPTPCLC